MSVHWHAHHHGHGDNFIRRLPAGLKLGTALAVVLLVVLAPPDRQTVFAAVAVFLLLGIFAGGISIWFLLKRILLLAPFVGGVVLVNALAPAGRANWLALAEKSSLCLLTVILAANTTPFSDTLRVLKKIRVPALLVTTIALMHRYLFVLADEAERMRRARASRTFTPQKHFQWRALATVVGQLFVRASERAERIYDAMCARGWK
jgi:cobalt/nickel transport system permease protein